jgi:hypothetical protein
MAVSDLNPPPLPETSSAFAADVYLLGALLHMLLRGYQTAFPAAQLPLAAQLNPALRLEGIWDAS